MPPTPSPANPYDVPTDADRARAIAGRWLRRQRLALALLGLVALAGVAGGFIWGGVEAAHTTALLRSGIPATGRVMSAAGNDVTVDFFAGSRREEAVLPVSGDPPPIGRLLPVRYARGNPADVAVAGLAVIPPDEGTYVALIALGIVCAVIWLPARLHVGSQRRVIGGWYMPANVIGLKRSPGRVRIRLRTYGSTALEIGAAPRARPGWPGDHELGVLGDSNRSPRFLLIDLTAGICLGFCRVREKPPF